MGRDGLQKLWTAVAGLGARRLIALAAVGVAVMAILSVAALYLGKPQREVLYSGLSRDDVGRIGSALRDAGMEFDVSADGATVNVNFGEAPRARMQLASKGLPQNSDSGYEIFNKVGSFGLTSFMQDVTKTRALEGELARSIQTMNGIRSARVHLVLPDRGSFRNDQQSASASVVISTVLPSDSAPSQAIRLLVAAAVPGLKLGNVNVLSTDGTVLASSDNADTASAGAKASVEQGINRDIEAKIRRTLTPYIGLGNFQVSVASRVNIDRTTTNETIFDPTSRVERSIRTVRDNSSAQNASAGNAATSVEQNLPTTQSSTDGGKSSNEANDRREETTNYEVSTKTIATAHEGYKIETLSIAVLVNQAQLDTASKGANALPVEHQTMEIEQLVAAAAGIDRTRGDQLKVAAVSFVEDNTPAAADPGILGNLMAQFGAILNAFAMVVVAIIAVMFGFRPAVKAILSRPTDAPTPAPAIAGDAGLAIGNATGGAGRGVAGPGSVNLIEDVTTRMNRSPQKRLEQIVEYDEAQAAAILRQWLRQDEAAA
jgi:flagellar M-ring protein FliF